MRIDTKKLKAEIRYLNHERNNGFPDCPVYSGPPAPARRREPVPESMEDFTKRFEAEYPIWQKLYGEYLKRDYTYQKRTGVQRATLLYSLAAHLRGKVHAQVEYLNDCTGALVRHERNYEDQEKMLTKAGLFSEFELPVDEYGVDEELA